MRILTACFYDTPASGDEQALGLVCGSSFLVGTNTLFVSRVILGKVGPRNSLAILFPFKTISESA